MGFTPIGYDSWERREFLEFFQQTAIYMTVQIDISVLYKNLRQRSLRLYPALVYCAAAVINRHPEFRYAYDEQRRIGIWDTVHPYYTVPRKNNKELFTMKCTRFCSGFADFYEAFAQDYAEAEICGRLQGDRMLPVNVCGISVVPGTHFSAFSFGGSPKNDFTPFTLFGKFVFDHGRVLLPVAGEFSHAVNDGTHVSRFFEELQKIACTLFEDEKDD